MKEDSRSYAWVAVLLVGVLLLGGAGALFLTGQTSTATLRPVALPSAATVEETPENPAERLTEEPAARLEEPGGEAKARVRVETAAAPPASTDGVLRLRIEHADGTPAHGALAVLLRGEELFDLGETDLAGACVLRGYGEPGELVLFGVTYPNFRTELPECQGERAVTLREGGVVSGLLLVDGAPPKQRRVLELDEWDNEFAALRQNKRVLARILERESQWGQPVAPDGSFRFSGLPPDWSGGLEISRELWLESGGHEVELAEPRENLVLRATRRPVIRGRVLMPEGEVPAPFAFLESKLSAERSSTTWTDAADAEGFFEIGIIGGLPAEDRTPYEEFELEVYDVERKGFRRLEITLEPHLSKDLGDIVLDATRDLSFLALDDATGEPVAGAVAYIELNRSEPTDDEGRSVLRGVRPDREEFQVLSIAHEETAVPIPSSSESELIVRLKRATTLEILAVDSEGTPVEGLAVQMNGECALFKGEGVAMPSSQHQALGAADAGNSSYSQRLGEIVRSETNFETDEAGRCLLVGVNPDCVFHLTVTDVLRHPLYAEEGIDLEPGEHRRIEVRATQTSRGLHGVLRDDLGVPIAGARIFARSAGILRRAGGGVFARRPVDEPNYYEDEGRSTTDEEGRWSFEALLTSEVDLLVTADGYATRALRDLEVPKRDGEPLELVLRRPRTVEIQISAAEEPLKDSIASLSAFLDGWRLKGLRFQGGEWLLDTAPDEEFVLQATCAKRSFTRSVLPADARVDWELPALGTARLSWNFPEAFAGSRSLQLFSVERPEEKLRRWLPKGTDEQEGVRGFRAFPGRYEARMTGSVVDGEAFVPLTETVLIEVVAGKGVEPVEVELRRK